jgi:biopolymer transport protein ExbB
VYGILKALISIGLSGQPSIDKVAGPVGEALIMTAIGLAVAVPAVFGYNILLRRNKAIQDSMREFTGDLESNLIGGLRPDLPAAHRAAPAARK